MRLIILKPVKLGVIGTGVGATFAAEGISLFASEGLVEIVAVADVYEEGAKRFCEKWKVKKWYKDYREMIEKEDLDAISIHTPHYLHYPMTMYALQAGKHVLVDKPIAINLKEADEMIEEADRRRLNLGVILPTRFDPVARKVKEAADTGKFGKLALAEALVKWYRDVDYYAKSSWRGRWDTEGGGALINQAIHMIDLMRWVMGPVDYLWAQIDTVGHDIEVEDVAAATLRFKNGAIGIIEGGTALYPGLPPKFEIHGVKGMAIIEGGILRKWVIEGEEEITEEGVKEGLKSWVRPDVVPAANHGELIKDFIKSIIEDRKPYVDGVEGRDSLEIIRAIYKSARTGRVVQFPVEE